MISGTVRNRDAIVELKLAGSGQPPKQIEAVVDTGYNGSLTIPGDLVTALRLPFEGHRRGQLADGSFVLMDVYKAVVHWHGQSRDVLVLQTSGMPLLGMSLLTGSRVILDVVEGGNITIEELKPAP